MKKQVILVLGPTATGKTALSISLAKELGGEIISADSMQIYKEMDIGTAKPSKAEMDGIPHHLIDIVYPDAEYSVAKFQELANEKIAEIISRDKMPIVVGGTGLYLRSLTHVLDFGPGNYDPVLREELSALQSNELYNMLRELDTQSAERIHPNNKQRVIRAIEIAKSGNKKEVYDFNKRNTKYDFVAIGLNCERSILYDRINKRVDIMMQSGLQNEVETLYKKYGGELVSMQGIGYKEFKPYFKGEKTIENVVDDIKQNTRRFAKRQLTWFLRDDFINWYDVIKYPTANELKNKLINDKVVGV